MIRPVTFVSAMMMLSSGAWLFVVKHQAMHLDHQIGGVTAQIRGSEQRIRVLRAEWALETDPNRLATLAALFMPQLKPMMPDQLVSWNELASRLPPVGAALPHLPMPPPLPGQLPADSGANAAVAMNQPVSSVPAPAPAPAPVHAAVRETAAVIYHAAPKPVRHDVSYRHHAPDHSQAHVRQVQAARRHPVQLGASVLAPVHVAHPIGARMMTITARAMPQQQEAPQPPRPVAVSASGSVFGGYAANLAPPRPAREAGR